MGGGVAALNGEREEQDREKDKRLQGREHRESVLLRGHGAKGVGCREMGVGCTGVATQAERN
jgi:hypothetical protein